MDFKSRLLSLCGNLQSFVPRSSPKSVSPFLVSFPFPMKFHGKFHPSFSLSLASLIPLSLYPSATPVLQTPNSYVLHSWAAPSPNLRFWEMLEAVTQHTWVLVLMEVYSIQCQQSVQSFNISFHPLPLFPRSHFHSSFLIFYGQSYLIFPKRKTDGNCSHVHICLHQPFPLIVMLWCGVPSS